MTVSVVRDLTATVTQCTDGTALCVQVLNVLHCCVLQVTATHKHDSVSKLRLVLKDNVHLHLLSVTFDPINKICPLNL